MSEKRTLKSANKKLAARLITQFITGLIIEIQSKWSLIFDPGDKHLDHPFDTICQPIISTKKATFTLYW